MFDYFPSIPNSSPDLVHHTHNDKVPSSNLYFRQQHQIIQLVEGPPPPPRNISSVIHSSSSSSYTSSSQASSDEDEDEDGSLCSSYCSSDAPSEHLVESPHRDDPSPSVLHPESSTETYSVRIKRILAWREDFSAHLSTTLAEPSSPLKRKLPFAAEDDDDDDCMSHTSKRSRSQASQGDASECSMSIDMHSCPACDACFATRQSLRNHGLEQGANEACSAAVEYAFE